MTDSPFFRTNPRAWLRELFAVAVGSADPARCVPSALPEPPAGRTVVVGAGKAAAAMALAVEQAVAAQWPSEARARLSGLVVTRYGHGAPCRRIEVVEAAHPVPDAAGRDGAGRMLDLVRGVRADDLVLCLISGGGSALLTLPDATTSADALAILDRHAIAVPAYLRRVLESGASETPKPGDARFAKHQVKVLASAEQALQAAADAARRAGIQPIILSDAIEGEAREVAKMHAALALRTRARNAPFAVPCVLLSGGETTVTVRGNGRGGRNAEFLLALAAALGGAPGIHALAADTDGIDGSEDNAGALCGPDTLARAQALGLAAARSLDDNDGYGFFAALGDLLVTGPTRTNVNDFRAILIL